MAQGAQPVWAGQEFRLDPTRLPQQLSYASRENGEAVEITVDRRGAVLKRAVESNDVAFDIALPNQAFKGVAARAMETGPESSLITLELLHQDNKPFNLKFRTTAYNDRLYHPPQNFQVLMNRILQ